MFQIDLNIDLREEPEMKSICLDMCNFVNILEYAWNIKCLNKPEF